jgi:hypothetical protein
MRVESREFVGQVSVASQSESVVASDRIASSGMRRREATPFKRGGYVFVRHPFWTDDDVLDGVRCDVCSLFPATCN